VSQHQLARAPLALAKLPSFRRSAEGKGILPLLQELKPGDEVQVTFKDTCEPDDVTLLFDMRGRGFIEFAKWDNNDRHIAAVYTSKNGWGHLPRSFTLVIRNLSSATSREHLQRLARRFVQVGLF
jgi:hypothetical protein